MRQVFRERGVVAETKGKPAVSFSHPAEWIFCAKKAGSAVLSAFFIGGIMMGAYLKKLPESLRELKNVRSLAAIAMLLALRVVLGMFANATLPMFGNTVKLSAAFIPIAVGGAMFGPVPAALIGALGDVISFVIAPTGGGYFPGFTISGLLTGLVYGFALYHETLKLPRIAIAWAVNTLVTETFLAALWLWILYAQQPDYGFYLTARLISQAVKCAPEILVLFALSKPIERLSSALRRKTVKG